MSAAAPGADSSRSATGAMAGGTSSAAPPPGTTQGSSSGDGGLNVMVVLAGTALAAAVVAGAVAYGVLASAERQKALRRKQRRALKKHSVAESFKARGSQAGGMRGNSGTRTTSRSTRAADLDRPPEYVENPFEQHSAGQEGGHPWTPTPLGRRHSSSLMEAQQVVDDKFARLSRQNSLTQANSGHVTSTFAAQSALAMRQAASEAGYAVH
eukprot:CAMPEP_0206139842 /NCGR_PEP_ID=MMETSP1473-20131121/7520_1 /ASSEMBLY_ACC=CAM_ASM_001109 /TAXON_ID=1461547 /ORGANISM="Stichococcus sp, Strain RCC1054" /LENGTH=210 /DNA_ID=CAMNT_0053533765 /DNA_START=244 /DNA_END=873 /DNA_ORIENTATION=+